MNISEEVWKAAQLLDKENKDWFNKIDIESLEIEEPCRCILGQLYGDYCHSPIILTYEDGFGGHLVLDDFEEIGAYTVAWIEQIEKRRNNENI